MTLTITKIHARAVALPIKRPPRPATGGIDQAAFVLIDLETDTAVTGRAFLFTFARSMLKPTADCVEALSTLIVGDEVAPLALEAKLRRHFTVYDTHGILGQALAGIDMAAWDALAQSQGVPLARALGGTIEPVPAYNSNGLWANESVERLPDLADELLEEGNFKAVKIRIGRPDFADDLAAVRAVRKSIGDDIMLMADFNQSLNVSEAIRRCRVLDDEGLYWIEEPVRHDDYQGCAKVAAAINTPVQIGENLLNSLELKKAIDTNASDFYMPDVQRIGGITGWLRATALTQASGLPMSSHLFPEISCHLLAVTPTRHWLEYMDWGNGILKQPLEIRDGHAIIPDRPGNGIEWDEDAVERFAVN